MKNVFSVLLIALALSACGTQRPMLGSPDNLACGLSDFYVDDLLQKSGTYAVPNEYAIASVRSKKKTINVLELSAGGEYGAYGAGFLQGWGSVKNAKPIDRNEIQIVTGVSTGALMATYAFLGDLDHDMRAKYEKLKDSDVYTANNLLQLITANSLYETSGKRELIRQYLTRDIIDRVSLTTNGRGLFIGMVNIDTGEFKRVDMVALAGAIADKDKRDACYRAVIDASSAIEIAFQPVFIDNNMFGDGGARRHLFMVSPEWLQKDMKVDVSDTQFNSFSLIHADLQADTQRVKNGVLQIAKKTADIFTDQGMKDSVRINHILAMNPELIVGKTNAEKLPRFNPRYAAASTAACECRRKTNVACERNVEASSKAADSFCPAYMQCLAGNGQEDGIEYAKSGNWQSFEALTLGSASGCLAEKTSTQRRIEFK